MIKYILVQHTDIERVQAALPKNYWVLFTRGDHMMVTGEDDHGWTADGYVLPRLSSNILAARLITPEQYHAEFDHVPHPHAWINIAQPKEVLA